MKLFILITLLAVYQNAISQDLIFNINQHGVAYKTSENHYDEASVRDTSLMITLQDKLVTLADGNSISLEKLSAQNNNIKHLYTQVWKAIDNMKTPVKFKFTVNIETREAMVELEYKDYKNYYFGKYAYGNMTDPLKKDGETASASN